MDISNLDKLKVVRTDLARRVISNRPFNTEELVNALFVITEALVQVMEPAGSETQTAAGSSKAPKEQMPEQRHL